MGQIYFSFGLVLFENKLFRNKRKIVTVIDMLGGRGREGSEIL